MLARSPARVNRSRRSDRGETRSRARTLSVWEWHRRKVHAAPACPCLTCAACAARPDPSLRARRHSSCYAQSVGRQCGLHRSPDRAQIHTSNRPLHEFTAREPESRLTTARRRVCWPSVPCGGSAAPPRCPTWSTPSARRPRPRCTSVISQEPRTRTQLEARQCIVSVVAIVESGAGAARAYWCTRSWLDRIGDDASTPDEALGLDRPFARAGSGSYVMARRQPDVERSDGGLAPHELDAVVAFVRILLG
jgi:hypothetical protein